MPMTLEKLSHEKIRILNLESNLEACIATLQDVSSRHRGVVNCDQGSLYDNTLVLACDNTVELLKEELAEIRDLKRTIFAELEFKYGRMNEDFCVTFAGTVESLKKEEKDAESR